MSDRTNKTRTWGFRFFATDGFVIGGLAALTLVLRQFENPLWWIVIVVAGHFFLFCNIVRIRRKYELIWAGLFLTNVAAWLFFGDLNCIRVLSIQFPITTALVFVELRSPRYHGVLA